ncbi:MAG: flavodoxin [Bacilli bacterium]|nr:flavodoxin [Bacilli bacterium]
MKKKILLSLLALVTLFTITGCGTKEESKNKSNSNKEAKKNSNSVVLYFSATGTTKSIAERIASKSGSDIIEIIPKEKYKSEDLNYNSDCRANREQNDSKARPEIENSIDISKYDTVYLGYPIWWGTNPKIILTLLDTYDFTGKNIIPFCTSGSTGISGSVSDLRNYNSNLNIKDGKRFSADASDDDINEFINNY